MDRPIEERDTNFPANPGPYNFPFTQNSHVEFEIIGYSNSSSTPEIYQIEFRPVKELGTRSTVIEESSGPRIIVEINIKTKKSLQVYMQPDA